MNFNFFGWIREKAKQAVLGGVGDAMDELDTDGGDVDALRKRIAASTAKMLPPADEPVSEVKVKKSK